MSEKSREPGHTVCIGWPTIRRVASEGAVYFAEHDVALVAADDLFHADVDAAAEERGRRAGIEEAAKWMRKPDAEQMRFTLEQKGFFELRAAVERKP